MLPAYSRCYAALRAAGLLTAADEADNHGLENLLLRENAVVWADQEAPQPNGVGAEEEPREKADGGGDGQHGRELAPILSFSRLLYHTNSPCSKSTVSHPVPARRFPARPQQIRFNFGFLAVTF